MALYYTLPVYRDTYRMILLIFAAVREFPREYKYSLGQDLRHDSIRLVRHIYRANSSVGGGEKKRWSGSATISCWSIPIRSCSRGWCRTWSVTCVRSWV